MILYGLALVLLAKTLRATFPDIVQPWYANDPAIHERASDIAGTMRLLLWLGPKRGYFPEPTKVSLLGLQLTTTDLPPSSRNSILTSKTDTIPSEASLVLPQPRKLGSSPRSTNGSKVYNFLLAPHDSIHSRPLPV